MASHSDPIPAATDPAPSLPKLAQGWVAAAGATVKSTTELAFAEARLAAVSVPAMLMAAVLSAACLLLGWVLLVSALAYSLVGLGITPAKAFLLIGAPHFLAAILLWRLVERLSRNLDFAHTRQHLAGSDEKTD